MRLLGLLGGMSFESTETYYRHINETVQAKRGGLHSAKMVMYSADFEEVVALQKAGDWQGATKLLGDAALGLKSMGAEALVICTNTMHILAEALTKHAAIPVLHIADAVAETIKAQGLQKVALLGTAYTMQQPFYKLHLQDKHGIEAIVPNEADQQVVHTIIFDELCKGVIREESKQAYQQIIARLVDSGAQGVILGCTEIGLLVTPQDAPVPLFDSAILHAKYAANWALA